MKEKIYYLSLYFSIFIVLLTINTIININTTVMIDKNEKLDERFSILKSELSLLEESECKKHIVKIADYIEKDSFEGKVKIKQLYEHFWNNPILSELSSQQQEVCNFIDAKNESFNHKLLLDLRLPELLFHNIYNLHEIVIKDSLREYTEAQSTNVDLNVIRTNRLNILEDLINEYKERGNTNEN